MRRHRRTFHWARHAILAAAIGVPAWAPVHAAGGHHAVDDAALLDPGQCEVETWVERQRDRGDGGSRLLHAGVGCRVGPVELGLGADRSRAAGGEAAGTVGAQLKWATELDAHWSVGVVLSGQWASRRNGGYQGGALVFPVSWKLDDKVTVHMNAGRDFGRDQPDAFRGGVAVEWAPVADWSLMAERFRQDDATAWRVAARWLPRPGLSVDLGRAAGGGAAALWTVGLNWVFGRPAH